MEQLYLFLVKYPNILIGAGALALLAFLYAQIGKWINGLKHRNK